LVRHIFDVLTLRALLIRSPRTGLGQDALTPDTERRAWRPGISQREARRGQAGDSGQML